ncbi:class I SAM-dependent DNA methyltransferase [Butyrivibrio sp.]|uniref:class I SAM-dependent DNA methyltransferase n=1 Tax=Butyrivibrio sp. TaxID=28121 RepID=UPI0025BBD417|nr:class I SAM-dependent DNA methyltransferase [Butyrivibrio sp.]
MAGGNTSAIVSKVWGLCNPLRDDGISYGDYLEQLTYLIFLKMSDEYSKPPYKRETGIPVGYTWSDMNTLKGAELETQYKNTLEKLGEQKGILGQIFKGAVNKISNVAILYKVVQMIDGEKWVAMSSDVKGEIYEGLLQKNAEDIKSGAGQYFTPRPLIQAMVECMCPEPGKTIADPCCGSGGFFLAAQAYLADPKNYTLDREQKEFLKNETFYGNEIVAATFKTALMNLYLHNIGDIYGEIPVTLGDALLSDPGYRVDYVLTNPPFGKKSSITFTNENDETEEEDLVYNRQDFWTTSSNKQLNFVQHINTILKATGKAAVVVPDNVLFEGGAGEIVRKKLLETTDLHTILRLPTGIFYKPGVKANVIFFDKKPASPEMQTKEVWIYDFRTNVHFTLKQHPMNYADLQDFIKCYNPENRYERHETWSEENLDGRWRKYKIDDILERDKTSLDIFWIKDKSLADLDNLPSPDELADDIIENLQSALESFQELQEQLKRRSIQEDKDYSYNSPANVIIRELSARYNVSLAKADTFEKQLEKIGFLEITAGDELIHSRTLEFCYLTINTKNGLTSRDRKPFNVVINLKNGMLEEIASAVIGLGISSAGLATSDNKLVSVASILGAVFSALSLTKINFSENETAILLALQNGSKTEEDCLRATNAILREYFYDELSEDTFMRAVNILYNCRCISIVEGILSIEETIKS